MNPANPASPLSPMNPLSPSSGLWNPASPYYHVYGPGAQVETHAEVQHQEPAPAVEDGDDTGLAWGVVLLAVLLGAIVAWAVVETR